MSAPGSGKAGSNRLPALTLTALGVVYGDIGTSPLYTIRVCFYGPYGVPVTHENVLGVLSLIIYALTALLPPRRTSAGGTHIAVLVGLGIFGAALLYGDGMITPAISVLGAV